MCRLVQLRVMHVMGYWRCSLAVERASNLPKFGRRRDASEPTTDLDIGNTRLGDTTRILIGRNYTLYLRIQEKFKNNGVEFGHSHLADD